MCRSLPEQIQLIRDRKIDPAEHDHTFQNRLLAALAGHTGSELLATAEEPPIVPVPDSLLRFACA